MTADTKVEPIPRSSSFSEERRKSSSLTLRIPLSRRRTVGPSFALSRYLWSSSTRKREA